MTGYQTVGSPEVQALMIDATDKSYFVTRQLEVSNASRSNLRTDQLEAEVRNKKREKNKRTNILN